MIRVRVPATSANLGPGFDCLGMALAIYNTIEMDEAPAEGVQVSVAGEGAEALSGAAGNMVAEAAERLFRAAGRRPRGLRLRVENAYPVARGLGSSAAAIVGGLVAANAMVGSPLGTDGLLDLAVEMEGHPDNVTPALLGGVTVACTVRDGAGQDGGARTVYARFDPPPGLRLALVIPERPLSTAEARAALPAAVPRADAVFNLQRACLLVASLQAGRTDLLGLALDDRLHQPYRAGLLPGLAEALAAARRPGLLGGCLSGSGSTVLLFLDPGEEALWGEAVDAVAGAFRRNGIACQVRFVSPSAAGAHVVASAGRGGKPERP